MALRLLTLDCANTLLRGSWDPVRFALWAARDAGLCLPRRAGEAYDILLRDRLPEIVAANRSGDAEAVREAHVRLGEAWLEGLDVDPRLASEVVDSAERLLVSPELFEPFSDVSPFLEKARAKGLRLAVVSNWDASLPRVLEAHGLLARVDAVYASLVVGAEKPDPTMLRLAIEWAGVSASETLHVGDDPVDDLGAARNADVRGVLLDRSLERKTPDGLRVASLMEVLDWID